ncbi:GNAT family N-acetyltransferase [Polaromonas sp. P1-6]|nr:GNAT family N-acetyltransferase [Polaromonas sp. P1-6]UUZ66898.1 GNAT family N-acetyltransferase [Polaromonas sp. P2-4]
MQVRDIQASEIEPVRQFLCANGWAHRVGSAEQFSVLLSNTQRTALALEGADIVGFARGITDGFSNGYLSMVVVSPAHQHQGIGSALVRHVTGNDPGITWVLRAGREGAQEFFEKLGFSVSSVAMERRRV